MKNKLNKKIIYLTLGATLLGPVACNEEFLEVPVTGQVTEVQLSSPAGLKGLLVGTYSVMNGRGNGWYAGASNWVWGSMRGGDANKGSDAGDQNLISPVITFNVDPVNGLLSQKWAGTFEGVSRANSFLASLAGSEEIAAEEKIELEAEGRFLRAFYYLELKKNFGNVPWIDELMTAEEAVLVTNEADIWPLIEADFKFAYDNLPETQGEAGRANKWAAGAFLGKVYMFQEKFSEAKAVFDQVMANGKTANGQTYALLENFADLWRGAFENNSESVFAYQAAAGTGNVNNANQDLVLAYPYNTGADGPGGCCGFFQPSFELTNSYRTADGLPLLDGTYNNGANALVTDQGVAADASFTPDEGPLDPRLDHTVGRRGIMFLDWIEHPGVAWIRDQGFGGPYTPKKFVYAREEIGTFQDGSSWTPGYSSVNFYLMRYADVLLMAAEAEAELGNLDAALTLVNKVRQRAIDSPLLDEEGNPEANYTVDLYESFADQETAIRAVRFERKLELALEGHRYYDLLRWGVVEEAINNYFDYEEEFLPNQFNQASFEPGEEFLPIPQAQIDLQGPDVLRQN